jgi:hypothetical protein
VLKVNFTGGFSGHSCDQEQDFDGNKAGFGNGGDNSTPWKRQKYGKGDRCGKGKGRGKQGKGRNGKGRDGKGKGSGKGGGGRPKKQHRCAVCEGLGNGEIASPQKMQVRL